MLFRSKHGHQSVNLLGDARKVTRNLIYALNGNVPSIPEWTEYARSIKKRCCCEIMRDNDPISPHRVMHEINSIIDDNTIITTDVGQNQMWAMHHLRIRHPRQFLTSGTFGTMGYGLPAAIGAKAACPDKNVVAIVGDGGLQMVIQELSTSVAEDLPITVILLNNGKLGMVRQMQTHFWEGRYSATDLGANPDFVTVARGFRAEGIHVERPSEIRDALKSAIGSGKTTVIEIMVDPSIDILPMLPANPSIPLIKGYCPF